MLGSAARTGLARASPPRRARTDRAMLPPAFPSRRAPAWSRAVARGSARGARPTLARVACLDGRACDATHARPPEPVAERTIRLDARPRVVERENRVSTVPPRFFHARVESHDARRSPVADSHSVPPLADAVRTSLASSPLDPTAMHAFAHPPAFAARSSRVARRFPFPPRRRATPTPESAPRTRLVARPRDARPARLARLGVAPRASAEDARRARTPRQARRDVHAPRTYTREDSVDGDESYSLLDAKGFGPPETETVGATSTWGAGTIHRARVASASSPDWPDRPDVVTASSTHTRHPHVVSVKLPRPVADHIKLAPRTAPPLSGAVAELRVRARVRVASEDERKTASFRFMYDAGKIPTYVILPITPHRSSAFSFPRAGPGRDRGGRGFRADGRGSHGGQPWFPRSGARARSAWGRSGGDGGRVETAVGLLRPARALLRHRARGVREERQAGDASVRAVRRVGNAVGRHSDVHRVARRGPDLRPPLALEVTRVFRATMSTRDAFLDFCATSTFSIPRNRL